MGKKYLVTTKKKVERYYTKGNDRAKFLKERRIVKFLAGLQNDEARELFSGKKESILDEVVYKTVLTGVYHCNAKTIRDFCKVGRTLLGQFNKLLQRSKQYIVARYKTSLTNCGGLIYIDTKHRDFYKIMDHLFSMSEYDADVFLMNIKPLIPIKKAVLPYQPTDALEEEEKETQLNLLAQFSTSEPTKVFLETIINLPSVEQFRIYAYKLALRLDKHLTFNNVKKAIKSFVDILSNIKTKTLPLDKDSSIVSVSAGAILKAISYDPVPIPEYKPIKKAPFYNWLEERE